MSDNEVSAADEADAKFLRKFGNEDDDELDDELVMKGAGITVTLYTSPEDGAPVVEIDTPSDGNEHETIRVYLNEARAEWRPS